MGGAKKSDSLRDSKRVSNAGARDGGGLKMESCDQGWPSKKWPFRRCHERGGGGNERTGAAYCRS